LTTGDVDVFETAGQQDAGVVDHHVEPARRRGEFAYPLGHFIGVGDVEMPGDGRCAKSVNLVGQ
jgi:hypothetical protein